MKRAFEHIDVDRSGSISAQELLTALRGLGEDEMEQAPYTLSLTLTLLREGDEMEQCPYTYTNSNTLFSEDEMEQAPITPTSTLQH